MIVSSLLFIPGCVSPKGKTRKEFHSSCQTLSFLFFFPFFILFSCFFRFIPFQAPIRCHYPDCVGNFSFFFFRLFSTWVKRVLFRAAFLTMAEIEEEKMNKNSLFFPSILYFSFDLVLLRLFERRKKEEAIDESNIVSNLSNNRRFGNKG